MNNSTDLGNLDNLIELGLVGYNYTRIRDQIGGDPISPSKSILVYIMFAGIFSTIFVIGYLFLENEGDWDKVFADDENYGGMSYE